MRLIPSTRQGSSSGLHSLDRSVPRALLANLPLLPLYAWHPLHLLSFPSTSIYISPCKTAPRCTRQCADYNPMATPDEHAAAQAISALAASCKEHERAQQKITSILNCDAPFIDIHELFALYDVLYFRSLLAPRVEVSWSSRLTLCAGICELVQDPDNGNKHSRIRLKLSESLLKFRPRSDVVNTLLHESIHAYFFITTSWRHSRGDDGTGHGDGFLLLSDAINDHGDYNITVYHTFHDEVDSYRTHVWQCNGSCRQQPPFFGLVKRSMNRPPGKNDSWWQRHADDCGGSYTKIAAPQLRRDQVEKLSAIKRAGLQKTKMDGWVNRNSASSESTITDTINNTGQKKRPEAFNIENTAAKRPSNLVDCPICRKEVEVVAINAHLDDEHAE